MRSNAIVYDLKNPETLANPFPVFKRLRNKDPVHWSPILKSWILTCYDDVKRAHVIKTLPPDRITQFSEFGQSDKVVDIVETADLAPVSGKSVTIRMLAMSINPSDILTIEGEYGVRPFLPFTPGGDVAAKVKTAIGDNSLRLGLDAIEALYRLNEIRAAVVAHAAKARRSGKVILTALNDYATQTQEN